MMNPKTTFRFDIRGKSFSDVPKIQCRVGTRKCGASGIPKTAVRRVTYWKDWITEACILGRLVL